MVAELTTKLTLLLEVVDRATSRLKSMDDLMGKLNSQQEQLNQRANRFIGLGFTMLFGFMALRRVASSFLKESFNAFKIAGAETEVFNIKTNELAASWEFFKFSLISALSQSPLFLLLIDALISLIDWFGQLSDSSRLALLAVVIGAFALSSAMMFLGTILLGAVGIATALGVSFGTVLVAMATIGAIVGFLAST